MELADQSTLVTGGGSGLGLATARALRSRGAAVTIVDLPRSDGAARGQELGARFVAADVTDEAAVGQALDAAEEAGPLRAVVHCAGRGGDALRILKKDRTPNPLQSFEDVLRINLIGTYNVLRLSAQRMAANDELDDGDRGAIVLTASVAAFDGQIGQTAYTAAKAGVHGITLVAARDLSTWAIRVNTIAPGTFETPMLQRFPAEVLERLAGSVPHPKRLGQPEQFGRLAIELLENSYLNGETVRLDGAIRMAPR